MTKKNKELHFFNQKLTRREFLKKSAIGLGGLFLGAYAAKGLLMKPYTYLKDKTILNVYDVIDKFNLRDRINNGLLN